LKVTAFAAAFGEANQFLFQELIFLFVTDSWYDENKEQKLTK